MERDEAEAVYVAICSQWPHLAVAGEAEQWARYLRGVSVDHAHRALKLLGERGSETMPTTGDFADAVRELRKANDRANSQRARSYAEIGKTYIEEARERLGGSE